MDSRAEREGVVFEGADLAAMRRAAAAIRAETIADLGTHLERFVANAEARGTRVHFAADGAEATATVRRLLSERGARSVVKSKSMVTEEIELNLALEGDGLDVVETDLGEYIVQLAGERPAHIIAPAVHLTRSDVRDLFERAHGVRLSDDPGELTAFARRVLRERFLAADAGITGVNFAVADTGAIVVVTNEGNARMCTSLPRMHIAVMGMERLVPSFRELTLLLPLLTGAASGLRVSAYVSVIQGPRRPEEADGPEEVHVVVVDGGRSALLGTRFESVLRCIRCGLCQNVCPVFRQIGGHGYGAVYGGPIGAVLTPLLEGVEARPDLPHASSLCIACTEACPVEIPLHEHLLALREIGATRTAPAAERLAFRAWALAWGGRRRYELSARLGRLGQLPLLRRGRVSRAPFPVSRWTSARDLPPLARRSFRERWRDLDDGP
jgi:L-lactate dehydrogenase complex protein LldF